MRALIVIVSALAIGASALATDHPQEARKLALRDRPGSSSLSWTSSMPAIELPAASPTVVGASLLIVAATAPSARRSTCRRRAGPRTRPRPVSSTCSRTGRRRSASRR